jgi:hypothetical protein
VTIATILGKMNVVDNELDIAVGGADETRAIAALDMAQDAFEAIVANHPDTLGKISTISTTANQEYTTWPSSLLRLDNLYLMNTSVTPNLPQWEIVIIQDVGGQAAVGSFPWLTGVGYSPSGTGAPTRAYTNRQYLFWTPVPDQVYTLRAYGFSSETDITTRGQTFAYPDYVANPMAVFATRLMEMGIDDPSAELKDLADELYGPVLNSLRQPTRQRPQARQYSRVHTT